jgi:sulfate permease, SulP family
MHIAKEAGRSMSAIIKRVFGPDPFSDLKAGLTTSLMLIPQSMAYAVLAGLPPQMGLYAATVPIFVYAIFGSSKQLSIGPAAMVSLLTLSGLAQQQAQHSLSDLELIQSAALLMAMVGISQLLMGVFKLGSLTRYLAPPVILGYTFAAALIISSSQVKGLFGVEIPRSAFVFDTLYSLIKNIRHSNGFSLALGLAAIFGLVLLKRWRRHFPRHLFVIGLSAMGVWYFELALKGVAIIGDVPEGLPSGTRPIFSWELFKNFIPTALLIAVISFIESFTIGITVCSDSEAPKPSRELLALGLANLSGAFFGAFPVSASFSRTSVHVQAGAKTKRGSVVAGLAILVILNYGAFLTYYIPIPILSALVITAVLGFIDLKKYRRVCLSGRNKAVFAITLAATLLLGVQYGIALGVLAHGLGQWSLSAVKTDMFKTKAA